MKKFLVFLICGIVSGAALAQETITKDRWYIQALIGANNTGTESLSLGSLSNNVGFTGSLELGYEFNPFIGLGLQGQFNRLHYIPESAKDVDPFNTIEGSLNFYWNLTNTFLGYKVNRMNAVRLFAGVSAAYASSLYTGYEYGDRTNNRDILGFRAGVQYERNLGKQWGLVAEAAINTLQDKLEDHKGGKMDSHVNLAIGVRKYFGGAYRKHRSDWKEEIVNTIVRRDTTVIKDIVEKKVPKDVYSIFFTIDKIDINASEVAKIKAVAEFMKSHPEKVVFVFGYADKNTGTKRRNAWLAKNRARVIIEQLTDTYGIEPSRIISYDQEGDNVQPFTEEEFEKNRATICVITDLVR